MNIGSLPTLLSRAASTHGDDTHWKLVDVCLLQTTWHVPSLILTLDHLCIYHWTSHAGSFSRMVPVACCFLLLPMEGLQKGGAHQWQVLSSDYGRCLRCFAVSLVVICKIPSKSLTVLLQRGLSSCNGCHITSTTYHHPVFSSEAGQHPTMVRILDLRSTACHTLDDVCLSHNNNLSWSKEADQTHVERENCSKDRGSDASVQRASRCAPARHQFGKLCPNPTS